MVLVLMGNWDEALDTLTRILKPVWITLNHFSRWSNQIIRHIATS